MSFQKKHIAVFKTGEGGDQRFINELSSNQNLDLFFITAKEIKDGGLKDFDSLIMPGCQSGQKTYRTPLGETGFKAINEAVFSQGIELLAVCGGAYVLSETVDWYYHGLKKIVHNEHALFKGTSTGPITPHRGGKGELPFVSQEISKSDGFNNSNAPNNLHMIYWGGGDFNCDESANQDINVLYYRELDQKPAIIQFKLGKGLVTLSNVHPEVSMDNLDNAEISLMFSDNMALFEPIKKDLIQNNAKRKQLLHFLVA